MKKKLKVVASMVGAIMVLALSPGVVGQTASGATPAVLPMTADSNGWIHFTNTQAPSLGLQNEITTTETGKIDPSGICTFTSSRTLAQSGSAGYSEETAFNPSTCQETVLSGTLVPAGQAKLNALTSAGSTQVATSPTVGTTGSTLPGAVAPKGIVTAASVGYADFEKVSYVDPLDITITSLTNNLSWQSNGTAVTGASATAVSYMFPLDNWSASAIGFTWAGYPTVNAYTSLEARQTFYNTDFERVMLAIMGISAYAACNFNANPATFYLAPWIYGEANGMYGYANTNSVSGGCSNLVHFRENHGSGSSS